MTVILIIVAVSAVPLALLVPSWVDTTRKSLQDRNASDALRESQLISSNVLVPSQIAPWMLDRIEIMERADSPAAWNRTSFTEGPCNTENLANLPEGPFADAIGVSCTDMQTIQTEFSSDCRSVQVCEISDAALARLDVVRVELLDAFADAGLVIPYTRDEEPVGP